MTTIEQLARDLLARLSYDYGDGEDCPAEVQALFDRGEQLLPVGTASDTASDTAAELAALRDENARLREAMERALDVDEPDSAIESLAMRQIISRALRGGE